VVRDTEEGMEALCVRDPQHVKLIHHDCMILRSWIFMHDTGESHIYSLGVDALRLYACIGAVGSITHSV
jgi:hypothetical protein